jgi:hypothetical protein
MSTGTTQQWLRQQVKQLPSVRNAHPSQNSEADLIIRTWVGMSVKVYFLDGVPNLRALKRVLHENTRTYNQATMFIAHHGLMPDDKHRLTPDDWMFALHELNSERIYTFIPGEPRLQQVHFDHLPGGKDREAWHGGDVKLERLRVLNQTAKTRALRGQWMMADFGQNPYWRTSDQRAQRLRAYYRVGPQTFTWTRYDMGGMPGGATDDALQRAHMGQLERCYQTLGIELTATQDEVKAAFRKLAREYHPDVSNLEKSEAEERFREINVAYEYIKSKQSWS